MTGSSRVSALVGEGSGLRWSFCFLFLADYLRSGRCFRDTSEQRCQELAADAREEMEQGEVGAAIEIANLWAERQLRVGNAAPLEPEVISCVLFWLRRARGEIAVDIIVDQVPLYRHQLQ